MSLPSVHQELSHQLENSLRSEIDTLAKSDRFSGVIRVSGLNTVLFEGAWGFAHRGWKIENTPSTLFRTASFTKIFTAVAILQLVESGKLGLDDSIHSLVSLDGSAIRKSVTIRHLITHTSGIADYFPDDESWPEILNTRPTYTLKSVSDFISLFSDLPPVFEPGARYKYCNAGFILLGRAIETVTGQNYFDVVRDRVFRPADMPRACSPTLDGIYNGLAEPYEIDQGGAWQKCISQTIPPAPDGGMAATVEEFEYFWRALLGGRLLREETLKEMLTPQAPMEPGWHYGFGLYIVESKEEPKRFEAHGFDAGVNAFIAHYPEHNIQVSVLSNLDDGAVDPYQLVRANISTVIRK